VNAIAGWLFAQGVVKGDRVAIAMRNYPEWILIYWACVSTGIAVVGMNAWWVPEEIEYALTDSAPKVVFCDAERLERDDIYRLVQTRPVHELVAEIANDLGLSPDWPDLDLPRSRQRSAGGGPRAQRSKERGVEEAGFKRSASASPLNDSS
jgi:acyl-CoA synthetase (AMP-forming)/AMP-acid ligase II